MTTPYQPGTICWYGQAGSRHVVEVLDGQEHCPPYTGSEHHIRFLAPVPDRPDRQWVWSKEQLTPLSPLELLALAAYG